MYIYIYTHLCVWLQKNILEMFGTSCGNCWKNCHDWRYLKRCSTIKGNMSWCCWLMSYKLLHGVFSERIHTPLSHGNGTSRWQVYGWKNEDEIMLGDFLLIYCTSRSWNDHWSTVDFLLVILFSETPVKGLQAQAFSRGAGIGCGNVVDVLGDGPI